MRKLIIICLWVIISTSTLFYGCANKEPIIPRQPPPNQYDPDRAEMDSDGDGIADYLERLGYFFEDGEFKPCNGDVSKPCFKTDPMQTSTDGDPYSDSMEVSGLHMDRSVLSPGDHPMIPAYPSIIVKLIGYDVTLNSTITETDGTQHQKGKTWNAETHDMTSTTDEWHWDVSEEVSCSLEDFGAKVSVSVGGSHATTHTTGTVKSNGGNIMESTQWSVATCSNPTEAAKIKLTFQAKNVGTCVAKDVRPKMNLKIGGKLVGTIYMDRENAIDSLEVGKTREWVAGSTDDIFLTYNELRSLETGASVAVEVREVEAMVVMKERGKWVDVGSWDTHMGEVRTICARLFLDLGDGNTTEHLVYAHDSKSAPVVTLKDAIIWAANGLDGPDGPIVRFYQTDGSLGPPKPLKGWYFSLDATTHANISSYIQNPDFNLFDTVLGPNTIVVAKAPPMEDWPKIRWATLSPRHEKVMAYVDDYFFADPKKLKVYFRDKNGNEHPMTWDKDEGYFSWACPADYFKKGTEKIVARNALYDPDKPDTRKWQTEIHASKMGYVPSFKHPYLVGSCNTPGSEYGIFVSGNYAYVMNRDFGLQVIDISNPAKPTLKGSYRTPEHTSGVFVSGDYAYVTDGKFGLHVIDISNPDRPNLKSLYHRERISRRIEHTIGVIVNYIGHTSGVFVSGDYAYVTDEKFGLQVIDISNPAIPTLKGSYRTIWIWGDTKIKIELAGAEGIFVLGNYAYLTNADFGLQVIDISDPAKPTLKGSYFTGGTAKEVFVSGNYAYVASGDFGLQVIDISDPAKPTLKGSYSTDAGDVFVVGDYAYVANTWRGLRVIDISNPAIPTLKGSYDTGRFAFGVFVSGNYAYMANPNSGLLVIGFK